MDRFQTPVLIQDLPTALQAFEALQSQALAQSVTLRPTPPVPTTCCGRGCNGCVWEGFYAAAQFWVENALAELA